jgi:hypothetical protein
VQKRTINITREEYGDIQKFIDLGKPVPELGRETQLKIFQVEFDGDVEADIVVINGDKPYVSGCLYHQEFEEEILDPVEELLGEHTFNFNGETYVVEISLMVPTVSQLAKNLKNKK